MGLAPEMIIARKKGIGGSEVPAILGLDNFSSPYKVWLVKTGREPGFQGNKFTKAGNMLESAVVQYFEDETKYRIIKSSAKQKQIVHPKHTFALGFPDRLFIKPQTVGRGVLEAKTCQASHDDVPVSWFTQLQWYMGISQMSYGAVAWLERGVDFKLQEFESDPEYFQFCITRVEEFWNNHILTDVPPDPINVQDITKMFSRHIEGKKIEATQEIRDIYAQLKAVREQLADLDTIEGELIDKIKFYMKDSEAVIDGAKSLFTWRTTSPISAFNKEKLKEERSDIYEKYAYLKDGVRKFLVKC